MMNIPLTAQYLNQNVATEEVVRSVQIELTDEQRNMVGKDMYVVDVTLPRAHTFVTIRKDILNAALQLSYREGQESWANTMEGPKEEVYGRDMMVSEKGSPDVGPGPICSSIV
jgi:hypothetical protein